MRFHLNGRCSPLLDGITFLKIKIGWALREKWALDHRIDIRPLGDAAEFSERERARLEYYPGYHAADVFDPVGDSFEVVDKS
jgi:hypothetical protein